MGQVAPAERLRAATKAAVQQRGTPMFGSPFASPFGSGTGNADRRHYERLFAPDAMKSLYD